MILLTRRPHSRDAMILSLPARGDPKSLTFFVGIILAAFPLFFYYFDVWDKSEQISSGEGTASIKAKASQETIHSPQPFNMCHQGGGTNCVVDGDTFWLDGEKIRIADIDTPETHPARCAHEAELGDAATKRLQDLLNAGPFSLQSTLRDTDRYGRKLRVIVRGGQSLGDTLVSEGLARPYAGGYREGWCA